MTVRPVNLEVTDQNRLQIEWMDGMVRQYTFSELRDHCPCATCRDNRKKEPPAPTALPILSPTEAQPLQIVQMHPVGNYAYSIHFSDGHNTGIYQFELLRELGEQI